MKIGYILALAMVLAFVAGAAYADYNSNAEYNYNYGYSPAQPQVCQPARAGAGPATCPPTCVTACPTADPCNVVPQGTCGAFCAAGQNAPGWPYNWCSEYWLRPNSNF